MVQQTYERLKPLEARMVYDITIDKLKDAFGIDGDEIFGCSVVMGSTLRLHTRKVSGGA